MLLRYAFDIFAEAQDNRRIRPTQKSALHQSESLPAAIQTVGDARYHLHDRAFILDRSPRSRFHRNAGMRVVNVATAHGKHCVDNVISLAGHMPIEFIQKLKIMTHACERTGIQKHVIRVANGRIER